MPDLKSLDIESVYLIVGAFVPGLIILFVRNQFLTGRSSSHTEAALSYLAATFIYYALALPAVSEISRHTRVGTPSWLSWLLLVFVSPMLFGLVLGIAAQHELLHKLLRKMGLNPVHAVPTAWDWKFARMGGEWALVVLKNDTKFAGYIGPQSFASSDPRERDVYLQKVYTVDDQKNWIPRASAVLIAAGEISTIEFWPAEQRTSNNEQQEHPLCTERSEFDSSVNGARLST